MRPALASLVALLALGPLGCRQGEPSSWQCSAEDAACLELELDDPAELVHGPQGGYHLEVGARFSGVTPERTLIMYEARRADGSLLGEVALRITPSLLVREADHLRRSGDILVLEITGPEGVVGAELDVEVHIERDGVELARDLRRIEVIDQLP